MKNRIDCLVIRRRVGRLMMATAETVMASHETVRALMGGRLKFQSQEL